MLYLMSRLRDLLDPSDAERKSRYLVPVALPAGRDAGAVREGIIEPAAECAEVNGSGSGSLLVSCEFGREGTSVNLPDFPGV